jgi:integrase
MLWVTGCRPAELEKGVVYMVHNGRLVVKIEGAKHGKIDNGEVVAERGMASRTIAVDPDLHPGARYLYDLALAEGIPRKLSYNKNSIRSRINEAGREVLAKLKDAPSLSPYSFRHAMASDLKSCDMITDEMRAQVMGHLSVESIESYGRRRRGGGGVSPFVKVQTSAQPHGKLSHAPPAEKSPKKRMRPLK